MLVEIVTVDSGDFAIRSVMLDVFEDPDRAAFKDPTVIFTCNPGSPFYSVLIFDDVDVMGSSVVDIGLNGRDFMGSKFGSVTEDELLDLVCRFGHSFRECMMLKNIEKSARDISFSNGM